MNDNTSRRFVGIHAHGAGNIIGDLNMISESPYNYEDIVGERIERNRRDFNLYSDTEDYTQEEYINAMEDLLVEEYAHGVRFRRNTIQRHHTYSTSQEHEQLLRSFVWRHLDV